MISKRPPVAPQRRFRKTRLSSIGDDHKNDNDDNDDDMENDGVAKQQQQQNVNLFSQKSDDNNNGVEYLSPGRRGSSRRRNNNPNANANENDDDDDDDDETIPSMTVVTPDSTGCTSPSSLDDNMDGSSSIPHHEHEHEQKHKHKPKHPRRKGHRRNHHCLSPPIDIYNNNNNNNNETISEQHRHHKKNTKKKKNRMYSTATARCVSPDVVHSVAAAAAAAEKEEELEYSSDGGGTAAPSSPLLVNSNQHYQENDDYFPTIVRRSNKNNDADIHIFQPELILPDSSDNNDHDDNDNDKVVVEVAAPEAQEHQSFLHLERYNNAIGIDNGDGDGEDSDNNDNDTDPESLIITRKQPPSRKTIDNCDGSTTAPRMKMDSTTSTTSFFSSVRKSKADLAKDMMEEVKVRKHKKKKRHLKEKDYLQKYYEEFLSERESLISQWKEEFETEHNVILNGAYNDDKPSSSSSSSKIRINTVFKAWKEQIFKPVVKQILDFFSLAEVFISNLPMTIGAVGLAWVTMGIVWFKFTEENLDSCVPVHFNSAQCTFPEFPGCFKCDTANPLYLLAVRFHYFCQFVGGTMVCLFIFKVLLAWKVVVDQLSSPTTATPCGVLCVTTVIVAAGRGQIGKVIVLSATACHFVLSIFFLYMALIKYRAKPEPSWFPNTVSLGYPAIKTWLYHPLMGKVLLTFSLTYFFALYFRSMFRVASNRKIPAQVCWMQMSAPSVALYAATMLGQPSQHYEKILQKSAEELSRFQRIHHQIYMPFQHVMFVFAVLGMFSAVHGLWSRWHVVKSKEFSPAHMAFCFPTLSHTNAVQAYRAAIGSFSTIPWHSPFTITLYSYWVVVLLIGTSVNMIMTAKFLYRLPEWTMVDVSGEEEPPSLNETEIVARDLVNAVDDIARGNQKVRNNLPAVSPVVLQSNEAGALVRVRRGTEDWRGPYVRTRKVAALGFEPTMEYEEFREERAYLLDWVARNAPRFRKRTMSVPQLSEAVAEAGDVGSPHYGTFVPYDVRSGAHPFHKRSNTDELAPWGS